ncbi:MAG: UDP-N-acetylmuramoyl-L-alanine--D-glutamate ligase [Clostridia bacterium]|nr:UDP-N-acetylmuramoyl-L-alanine--D-glutamate ligase [Clostridia bacterium]
MTKLIQEIKKALDGKSIVILGFGREGKATYHFVKKYVNYKELAIADERQAEVPEKVYYGTDYCEGLNDFDVVIKSPGISFKELKGKVDFEKVTSQTELVLNFYRKNMIGITGTKGKSTTSSLIYAILQEAKVNTRLVGNIGIPIFECLEEITDETVLVCEMSSHQLEKIVVSPHIGVLLNLFEEHLDHYESYEEYQLSKVNIFRHQSAEDFVVYNAENELTVKYVESYAKGKKIAFPFPIAIPSHLLGKHNQNNISAAVAVAKLLGIPKEVWEKAVGDFKGLPHRLEFVGTYEGIRYYNDSISTVPEATMAAVESLKEVDTLILGGMDRGVHYDSLIAFLNEGRVRNIILAYETGKRIAKGLNCSGVYLVEDLEEAVNVAKKVTQKDKICLLSPAAASYGYFKNFEERGERFKEWIKS